MVEFLSDAWIAALAGACPIAAVGPPDAPRFVIEPVVRDVPGRGEVRYRIELASNQWSVGVAAVEAEPADVYLVTGYATAVALSRGETNAQAALAEGRLRISGDVARLAAHGADLARLDDLFVSVRAATTYPPL